MIDHLKRDYRNVLTNVGAFIVFAQTIYPGLNAEMIMLSVQNGTIVQALMNIAFCYILANYGKDNQT
jgi:hypothetical protein